jgi:hypothetical protein
MTDSRADDDPRDGGPAPAGGGGQYVDGDYGDAGTTNTPPENQEDGEYPDGDYGGAGSSGSNQEEAIHDGLTGGQVQGTDQERGQLHGSRGTDED